MYELNFDPAICEACESVSCLMKCQYLDMDFQTAKHHRSLIARGQDSSVLKDCVTCYACEEYCPYGNHPFYRIVELQDEKHIQPVPGPLTRQQLHLMRPQYLITKKTVHSPLINMCAFSMLEGCIRGSLFDGVSVISGSDIFCNIMWLHFGTGTTIKERLPKAAWNIQHYYLEDSGIQEVIHFHDECYGAYTHLAPAMGIDIPFKSIHLFSFLHQRLNDLKDRIKPLNQIVAYQRPCSNRLVPETDILADKIFDQIGAIRAERKYDRENALCCTYAQQAQQRDETADDVMKRNIEDMKSVNASYCVFNCPACFFTMSETVAENGMIPILISDLCLMALGE
ncbi:MAG: heterodisulfide reductase-related iron-sulfur binding cluster [Desulfobacterales bacterium]